MLFSDAEKRKAAFSSDLGSPFRSRDSGDFSQRSGQYHRSSRQSFEGKWIVKFSAVTVLYPIAMSLNNLHMDMGVHLYHLLLPGKSDEESDIYASLSYGLVVLFWYLFYRLQKNSLQKIYQILDARAWLMVNIICAASFVSVLSCTYFAPTPTYFIWPALAACIVTNVGSVRLAASYLADGIYADMERRNLQLQQNYYRELEANQKQIRKLRHDLNNHLMVVGRLFDAIAAM